MSKKISYLNARSSPSTAPIRLILDSFSSERNALSNSRPIRELPATQRAVRQVLWREGKRHESDPVSSTESFVEGTFVCLHQIEEVPVQSAHQARHGRSMARK